MVAVCSRKGKFCVNISVIFLFNLFLRVAYIVQRAILSLSCSHDLDDVSGDGKFWNVLCPGSRASPRLRPRPPSYALGASPQTDAVHLRSANLYFLCLSQVVVVCLSFLFILRVIPTITL